MAPYKLKDQDVCVPCGNCPNCWKRRISAWSFRLRKELNVSRSASWPTLTYNDENLPFDNREIPELRKSHLQSFFKRLRKLQFGSERGDIKYFAVGEYGGYLGRPHYHVLLFNADVELVEKAWCVNGKSVGNVMFGDVNAASIGYTLKYMCKPGMKLSDDRQPQFALMSKKLGVSYLTEAMISWHKANLEDRMYCPDLDGKKVCMPRYYKDKIYEDSEREYAAQKAIISGRDKEYQSILDGFKEFGDSYYSHRTKCLARAYNLVFEQSKKRRDL